MMNVLTALVPWPYRVLAIIALAVALVGFGWVKGASQVRAEWDAAISKQAIQVAEVKQRQAEATARVVTKYVDRIQVVRETGDSIIKEVPKYVPSDSPYLPAGFRLLHDAAAGGYPVSAISADAAAVPAETAAETVVGNYTVCRENSERLASLQEWVRSQEAATK